MTTKTKETIEQAYQRGYQDGYAARHGGGGAKPIGERPGEEKLLADFVAIIEKDPDITSGVLAAKLAALGHKTRSGAPFTRDAALRLRRQLAG